MTKENFAQTAEAVRETTVSVIPVMTEVVNPIGEGRFDSLADLFGFAFNLILGVGWSLFLIMLALGFIQYILARGEKTAVENAQKWITYSVIGGVGLLLTMVIRNLVPKLMGVQGINIPGVSI